MSRIDEALARASTGRSRAANAATVHEATFVSPEEWTLAHYLREVPCERPEPATPAETPVPTVSPSRTGRATGIAALAAAEPKLVLGHAAPVAVEQYRRLAGTLHGLQAEHGINTLMVTSAVPREGKTLTVTNLALTLSESCDRRVLLIDADLRRPSVHELLRLPNTRGLSEALASDPGGLPIVAVSSRLSVLPAGGGDVNPMTALTSERMNAVLEKAAAGFDWVLVDTPPVGIMPDAHLLAQLVQGVIFVIAAGSTAYSLVERAVTEVGRDQIIGTVLNRVEEGNNPATSYYEQYYGAGIAR